jgi:hypothetical protein
VQLAAYRTLFLLGAIACVLHLRRRRFADAGLLVAFGGLSLLAVRNLGLYAVVALPAVAVALDEWLGEAEEGGPAWRPQLRDALWVACLGFALLCIPRVVSGTFYAQDRRPDRFEASWCRECLAFETADWLARSDLAGRGLNDLRLGSVLVWRDPAHPVFIDGRNEVTGEAFYARYLRALDPARWAETQREFALDYVALMHRGDPRAAKLSRRLLADPDWRLVHVDGAGVVFVRASGPNGSVPQAELPLPPSDDERLARLARIRVEAGRLEAWRRWLWSTEPPPGDAFALGNFLARAGETAAAERPLLEAAESSPGFFEPHFDLGLVYRDLGNKRAALLALRHAKALAPSHPDLAPIRVPGGAL